MRVHLTKFKGHSYSLIYSFLNFANISFAVFEVVLPLDFVRSISGSTTFISRLLSIAFVFCTLYPWLYEAWATSWHPIYFRTGKTKQSDTALEPCGAGYWLLRNCGHCFWYFLSQKILTERGSSKKMNDYPSLSLEKVTRDVRVLMKYQQDQMILRALM